MANLKKEVMSLISRFDAAQEAFTANSAELKSVQKKHKKELKEAKAEAKRYRTEVEALKAEMAVMKMSAPAKSSAPSKGSPGRPKKKTTTTKASTTAKRGPGRPKKAATAVAPAAKTSAKRAPGRPKKSTALPVAVASPVEAAMSAEVVTPVKATTAKKAKVAAKAKAKPATGATRRPGRPRTKPVVAASALEAVKGVGPAMARQFEAAGVKTPAAMSKLSNVKMKAILEQCGPRYRNADSAKMQTYRDAAMAAK